MLIDQAIFSSARTARADGYQIVAASHGVAEDESRELAIWGPSHGSLCQRDGNESSVSFHRLESGRFCISKTTAAGEEYSGRGRRIDTQFFLVAEEVLARFANNPFAVLRAVWAKGLISGCGSPGARLEGFSLVGRCPIVDEGLLAQWADRSGPRRVARVVAAAQTPNAKLLAGVENMETLIGGVLNCLPVECRPEVSFSTGLLFSPRRPYRLGPLETESPDPRLNHRTAGVETVDLAQQAPTAEPPQGWAAYVAELITADQLAILVAQLQQPRPGLRMDHLDALGEQLLSEFRRSRLTAPMAPSRRSDRIRHSPKQQVDFMSSSREPLGAGKLRQKNTDLGGLSAPAKAPVFAPDSDPQSAQLLEQLDDAVFDSVNSEPGAIERVHQLWDRLGEQLGADARRAAREQYLRYTLTLWEGCLDEGLRDPQQAVAALDVLSVLFDAE